MLPLIYRVIQRFLREYTLVVVGEQQKRKQNPWGYEKERKTRRVKREARKERKTKGEGKGEGERTKRR